MADYMYPPRRHHGGPPDGYRGHDYRRPRHHGPEKRRPRTRSLDQGPAPAAPARDRRPREHLRDHRSPELRRHHGRTRSLDRYRDRRRDHSPRGRHRRHEDFSPPRGSRRSHDHRAHPHRRRRAVSDTRPDDKLQHAAKAAVDAAAVEAIRVRHHPGEWTGEKGARVATAALGAAATDKVTDKLRDHGDAKDHSKRDLISSTIGGLLANRVVNGPRRG